MNRLNSFDFLFVSVAYAEERIFKNFAWHELLWKWDETWTTVAFAEEGCGLAVPEKAAAGNHSEHCQLGDISCFMKLNA